MREYEFRGKDKITGEWRYGNLIIREEESPVPETTESYKQYYIGDTCFGGREYEVIPEPVGQYTGFLDDEKNKIFEGDIVKIESMYDEIVVGGICFHDGQWAIDLEFDFESLYQQLELNRCSFKVIGNIHDNPELLEAQ